MVEPPIWHQGHLFVSTREFRQALTGKARRRKESRFDKHASGNFQDREHHARIGSFSEARAVDVILRLIRAQGRVVRRRHTIKLLSSKGFVPIASRISMVSHDSTPLVMGTSNDSEMFMASNVCNNDPKSSWRRAQSKLLSHERAAFAEIRKHHPSEDCMTRSSEACGKWKPSYSKK